MRRVKRLAGRFESAGEDFGRSAKGRRLAEEVLESVEIPIYRSSGCLLPLLVVVSSIPTRPFTVSLRNLTITNRPFLNSLLSKETKEVESTTCHTIIIVTKMNYALKYLISRLSLKKTKNCRITHENGNVACNYADFGDKSLHGERVLIPMPTAPGSGDYLLVFLNGLSMPTHTNEPDFRIIGYAGRFCEALSARFVGARSLV